MSAAHPGNLKLDAQGDNNVQVFAIVGLSPDGCVARKEKDNNIVLMQEFQCLYIPSHEACPIKEQDCGVVAFWGRDSTK